MTSNQNSPPASIFRPAVFTVLGVALLACGAFQSITAYPSPAALTHLGDALSALWSSIGFVLGLTLLIGGLLLLVPSSYLLRLRWQRRQAIGVRAHGRSAVFAASAGRRPPEDYEFGPQFPAEDYRYDGGTDPIDSYTGDPDGPIDGYGYEDERSGGRDRGRSNGHGRSREHARFEQRRWAGSSRERRML